MRVANHVKEALRGRGQGQVTKDKKLFVTLLFCNVKHKNMTQIKWGQYILGICQLVTVSFSTFTSSVPAFFLQVNQVKDGGLNPDVTKRS